MLLVHVPGRVVHPPPVPATGPLHFRQGAATCVAAVSRGNLCGSHGGASSLPPPPLSPFRFEGISISLYLRVLPRPERSPPPVRHCTPPAVAPTGPPGTTLRRPGGGGPCPAAERRSAPLHPVEPSRQVGRAIGADGAGLVVYRLPVRGRPARPPSTAAQTGGSGSSNALETSLGAEAAVGARLARGGTQLPAARPRVLHPWQRRAGRWWVGREWPSCLLPPHRCAHARIVCWAGGTL